MFGHPDARPLWHQSPLPYLLTGIAFKYLGSSEKVARLIPLVFTLLAGFFLYRLLAELWDRPTGLLGLFAFWMSPPVIVFAMSNNHIVLSLATMLLSIYVWTKAFNNTSWRWMAAAITLAVLAMWTYWHAYFLPFFFALAEVRHGNLPLKIRRALVWAALPFMSFAAFLLFQYQQNPDGLRDLMDTALNRSGVSVSSWELGRTLNVIFAEIGLLWHPVHVFIALGFIGLAVTQADVLLGDPRRQTVVLALGGCSILYWIAMARIAALEPMFNALMLGKRPVIPVLLAAG